MTTTAKQALEINSAASTSRVVKYLAALGDEKTQGSLVVIER
ncbi:MAG: hypothetical protein ACYDH9_25590 [Limisphaerales bacterium]